MSRVVFFLNFLCPSSFITMSLDFCCCCWMNATTTTTNQPQNLHEFLWYMSNPFQFAIIYTWTISSSRFDDLMCVCVLSHKLTCSYQILSHFVTNSIKSGIIKIISRLPMCVCVCLCDIFVSLLIKDNDMEMLSSKNLTARMCSQIHTNRNCWNKYNAASFKLVGSSASVTIHCLIISVMLEKFFAGFCVVHFEFKNFYWKKKKCSICLW